MKRIGTVVLGLIMATLSPFVVLSMVGLGYIMYVMVAQGIVWSEGLEQFVTVVLALQPYFAYMTGIPLILMGVIMAARRQRM
ncbi:MAG: hypothetical protein RI985_1804 [Chloroflexota bacterium]|jgi:hypothetical protein